MIDKSHLAVMLSGDFFCINDTILKNCGFRNSENFGFCASKLISVPNVFLIMCMGSSEQ